MVHVLLSLLLASNAAGKTLVRQQQGTLVPKASASVPLFSPPVNTIAHVWFDGQRLRDKVGNAWAVNGTIPQISRSGRTPAGAGPFSDANYYSLGSGADVGDIATGTDWYVCVIYGWDGTGGQFNTLIDDMENTSAFTGFKVQSSNAGTPFVSITVYDSGGNPISASAGGAVSTDVNVACGGMSGTNLLAKGNLGAVASSATSGGSRPAPTVAWKLGRENRTGFASTHLVLYEMLFVRGTPSDALFTSLETQIKAKAGTTAW